jgi:uncharacterized surface protein with fasciclin (FAS1) repeats
MTRIFGILALLAAVANAFQVNNGSYFRPSRSATTRLYSEATENADLILVKNYLADNYPALSVLLQKNDNVWKALGGSDKGFTVFAPTAGAFSALGNDMLSQLADARNRETAEKISAYHVIAEVVTAEELFQAGGIITLGGEVPVGRSTTGGMFGLGGKEDGGVTINGAKVTKSIEIANGVLHEVDTLMSPQLLLRYLNQLRIPGSK